MLDHLRLLAVGATLLAALGAACTTDEATTGSRAAESPAHPTVLRVGDANMIGVEPKPPLDTTPITPTETVGASRVE